MRSLLPNKNTSLPICLWSHRFGCGCCGCGSSCWHSFFLVSSFSRMSHTSRELLLLFAAMISIYLTNYCRAGCSLHHFGCAFFLWNVSTPSIFSFRVLPQRLKTNALSRQPKPNQWRRILDSNHISLDVARKECSNAFIMNFACWCLPQFQNYYKQQQQQQQRAKEIVNVDEHRVELKQINWMWT